jgi:GT2 family glycosyltransferase/glycosyltransferase involved in cell wall biosynthesis
MTTTGPTTPVVFPPLPPSPAGATPRKLKVCIASVDFVGPVKNGGVGTAFTSLGEALAAAGHEVTLLYIGGQWCENETIDHWVAWYACKGIRFVPMPAMCPHPIEWSWAGIQSYHAYLWCKQQQFDIIHFSEWMGSGYFSLRAKQQGLAFSRTVLCLHTHGPSLWHTLSNAEWVDTPESLVRDYMERTSVRLADVVVSPSQYLLRWMLEQGWTLPARTHVEQYVRPATARRPLPVRGDAVTHPDEVVFFGRLEHRKGLVLFCDALDQLAGDPALAHLTVTFLGKAVDVHGKPAAEYLTERARRWPWTWSILSDRDQAGAMDYLQGGARLVVIPSLVDNLPNTVLECLGANLPFIASNAGGIPEMIAADDLARTCFELRPAALAARLRAVVQHGHRPPRQAGRPADTEAAWVRWHETAVFGTADMAPLPADRPRPLVSVCVPHWNRPHYLAQAVASIEAQDYPNLELLVVDDASTSAEARAYLDDLERRVAPRGWRVLRQPENRFPGAARNRAAREARGEYLFFMDDDNVAKPGELTTFVDVAQRTGADILTCFLDTFEDRHAPGPETKPNSRVLFLGDCPSTGALQNTFGDTNSLVRRSTFLALGGFHEQWGVGHEDHEFMAKAVLGGYRLEVIPEAMVWYRVNKGETSIQRSTPVHANLQRSLQPVLAAVPRDLRNLVQYALGLTIHRPAAAPDSAATDALIREHLLWKGKLEAALVFVELGRPKIAAKLMVDAIKAVGGSTNPRVILGAILGVAPHLGRIDPAQARFFLQLAASSADDLGWPEVRTVADTLVTRLPACA